MTAAATFAPMLRDVAIELLGKPAHATGDCLRWGSRGSLKIDAKEGVWHDKEANEGGGTLDFIMREVGCDKIGALGWLESKGFLDPADRKEPKRYLYRDASGQVRYAKVRLDLPERKYTYQHPVGDGWRAGRGGIGAIPYRLPELLAAPSDAVLYMAEGEAKADKLASWGLLATSHKDWRAAYAEHVKGRTVVILPDNDEGGALQARDAAALVCRAGGQPVLVELPGLPPKGDIIDWTGTRDDLAKLVERAHKTPPSQPKFSHGISAAALMAKTFEPIRWIIPGYLPEGMAVLAGGPKLGKTWLALDWLVAVGSGGKAMGSIDCEQGDVLGLMLEDNERRLQRRLRQMRRIGLPERMTLVTEWPNLDDGCVAEIEAWIAASENPRLIVIDVFARVKGSRGPKETDYDADYR